MRILGLFVLGLSLMAVGCTPPASNEMAPKAPPSTGPASSGTTHAAIPSGVDKNTKLVNMKVSMTCPHGCYPVVKRTLEKEAGVEGVTLAQQKDPDTIDNPVVYITTNTSFDAEKAMAALKTEGFTSEVLN